MSNPGFLLAEDAAIKARFSNIAVSDDKNPTRVAKVFFRYPEGETEKEYPFITIENVGLSHNRQLQHSEEYYYFAPGAGGASIPTSAYVDYYPSELNSSGMSTELASSGAAYLRVESFVPITLIYQVSTYARSALHDRQLTAKILRRVAPFRRGFIEIPEDGTVRRFDLMSWGNSDLLDGESGYRKRVFRKVYTIHMSAEMPASDIVGIKQVASVVGNITNADNENPTVFTTPFSEEF
jgi:hypothetical protein